MDPIKDKDFFLQSYHYDLPPELIAQEPAVSRDASRLLLVDCRHDRLSDLLFPDLTALFCAGDLLVVNNTRVFPARLNGRKKTGGRVELFLLEFPGGAGAPVSAGSGWNGVVVRGLIRSSKPSGPGTRIEFGDDLAAEVLERTADGQIRLRLYFRDDLETVLGRHGVVPLPPYIRRDGGERSADRNRYQTVYASETGAVAAPTAGLHFTDDLLSSIRRRGAGVASLTLHVGYGTFAPVRENDIRLHRIHAEYIDVPAETALLVNETRARGGRVWCVGTTTARALEFAAAEDGAVVSGSGWCDLYIYPGYTFRVVRNLITNFHLPCSSLLFLVSALAGREHVLRAYRHAVAAGYRFYSYGDAMAIVTDA